jgi:LysR family transcriptional activator of nhaA
LAGHRLDLVLADEPASSSTQIRTFNHLLGQTGVTFCAVPKLAATLRKGFPKSLNEAPALVPSENTATRRSLEKWFQERGIRPRVVAEFEDAALMKVMAADGKGFIPVPTLVKQEALDRYGLEVIGATEENLDSFYAITAERRIDHPAVAMITQQAQKTGKGPAKDGRWSSGAERA